MASLSEQIDRFSRSTKFIKTTATQTAVRGGRFKLSDIGFAGPFTRAILTTDLGDLIRDVDSSELGLFHLLNPSQHSSIEKDAPKLPPSGLARIEFGSATPLKRVITRRDESTKLNIEPEIYARAAIKYIDRYDPIRRMPRAHSQATSILQRLNDVRQNMRVLLQSLERTNSEGHPSLKSLNEREEERLSEIRAEIASLRERRQAALARPKSTEGSASEPEATHTQFSSAAFLSDEPIPISSGRILHFADNLMDEAIDLGHLPNVSITGHARVPEAVVDGDHLVKPQATDYQKSMEDERSLEGLSQTTTKMQISNQATAIQRVSQESTPHMDAAMQQVIPHETQLPIPSPPTIAPGYSISNGYKIRMDGDLRYVMTKIWQTAADIIGLPGQLNNHVDNTTEVPCAEETLARLDHLSKLEVSQSSASAASDVSITQPTAQQILTAHLLLLLLSAPHHSLPLNKVKQLLAAKAGSNIAGAGGQGTTRVIYGCVAKRLLKIDRSGREQIVKFDM